jgi:hypothetical protein
LEPVKLLTYYDDDVNEIHSAFDAGGVTLNFVNGSLYSVHVTREPE